MTKYIAVSLVLFVAFFYSCKTGESTSSEDGIKVMAYYYPGRGNFEPASLPLDKLTHIIWSFTEVIDNEMKFKRDTSGIMLKSLVKQKRKHPHLKVMPHCKARAP